uniref:Calponin n=1 Tax=Ciona intestinalis TaxID=7719 RepID=F6V2S0_CIOIN
MAQREKGYGLSREIANKLNAKYDADDEKTVVAWIASVIHYNGAVPSGKDAVHTWLRDGNILCSVINTLKPGTIRKLKKNAMRKNKEQENISFFLKAAEDFGVQKTDLFQTVDLYEQQNMAQVLSTIYKLDSAAQKKGYSTGATIGVKIADKNIRNHDEAKLKEGRNVIGLQMGTNKGPSQSGQNFGMERKIRD